MIADPVLGVRIATAGAILDRPDLIEQLIDNLSLVVVHGYPLAGTLVASTDFVRGITWRRSKSSRVQRRGQSTHFCSCPKPVQAAGEGIFVWRFDSLRFK